MNGLSRMVAGQQPHESPFREPRLLADNAPVAVACWMAVLAAVYFGIGCGLPGDREQTASELHARDPRTPAPNHRPGDCGRPDQCLAGYDHFLVAASTHAEPIDRNTLWAHLWAIIDERASIADAVPEGSTLDAELLRDSNLRWLLGEADRKRAVVTQCGETLWGPAKQITLCIKDPWVGSFTALLLLPGAVGPYPAIVAHPGHAESAAYHRDYRLGRDLLEAGYALAVLEPRAFAGDEFEHAITERLLLQGHTLVGLRLYELAVIHGYLASLALVDGDHIGLLGHSGGSDAASLAAFIDPRWEAVALDLMGWFMARIDQNRQLSSEVSPALWRWHRLMKTGKPAVPRLMQAYGFPRGAEPLIQFFDQHLKPASSPPQQAP